MAIIDPSDDGKASLLGWQRIHTSRLYDRALRFSFAFWWMLLAVSHTRGAAALFLHDVAAGWSGQEAALLASRICLCLFLLLIAWVTLQRMQPVAKAKGVLPRLFAAL